ncbi:transcription antitermination factor NusB [Cognatishimia sp. SS12]|uniref:transcription antitermination factor NusB n=1 Tax=Cognatishimia sp. SS12 TaxID=2979465 RepID=UPI00232E215D|nr:transcription antitermination factor NusB [Cognatishimia sp. SS12]MDC0736871.1 transcription antitermination factor NusB [Cognatishimia sp. SS12]
MTSETKAGLSGNQKRKMKSAARFFAVQALYQMEHSDQTYDQVRVQFLDHRFGEIFDGYEMLEGDVPLFSSLLEEAVNNQALIDQMTDRALVAKWPLGRIDSTLRALFRAAGAELTQMDTPPKVVIVEFVQIAQAFFPEGKEGRFVNGVLDHMAREAKPEAF